MNIARSDAAVAVLNGLIYVAGGKGDHVSVYSAGLEHVESFDPQNDEWTTLSPMIECQHSIPVFGWKGNIYAIGYKRIEKYDPLTKRWTKVSCACSSSYQKEQPNRTMRCSYTDIFISGSIKHTEQTNFRCSGGQ